MELLILDGDGIGPEITASARACLKALDHRHGLGIVMRDMRVGFAALEQDGSTCPPSLIAAAKAADGVIMGPLSTADYPDRSEGGVNPSAAMRTSLDLYANMRPSYVRAGVDAHVGPFDVLIARENTEGFYADRTMFAGQGEFMPTDEVALAVRKITRTGCRRIARAAFEAARRRKKHVTAVHKANVLKLSDGLFYDVCAEVAQEYPDVTFDDHHIDAMASLLVRTPERFDVLVTTNMFGDILSNLAAELSGGLGLAESLNQGDHHAMAQASHGSAPDIAGQGKANPTALILSVEMLLRWLANRHDKPRFNDAADELKAAVLSALTDPARRTPDLGGKGSTQDFTNAILEKLG